MSRGDASPPNEAVHPAGPRARFSAEEDAKLLRLQQQQLDWNEISRQLGNRSARQCRERFQNYLDPELNTSNWTPDEDELLLQKESEMGKKWKKMMPYFQNRSNVNIKNRFATLQNRKKANDRLASLAQNSHANNAKNNNNTNNSKHTAQAPHKQSPVQQTSNPNSPMIQTQNVNNDNDNKSPLQLNQIQNQFQQQQQFNPMNQVNQMYSMYQPMNQMNMIQYQQIQMQQMNNQNLMNQMNQNLINQNILNMQQQMQMQQQYQNQQNLFQQQQQQLPQQQQQQQQQYFQNQQIQIKQQPQNLGSDIAYDPTDQIIEDIFGDEQESQLRWNFLDSEIGSNSYNSFFNESNMF